MQVVFRPRAERVALKIPIAYYQTGDEQWFQAKVVNVSESGMLFGPSELSPGMPVEVMFSPPMQIGALAPGKQVCRGEVVRATPMSVVAVRFDECRFLLEP